MDYARRIALACFVAVLAAAFARPVRAHEYWIMPSVLAGPAPLDVALTLWVGDGFVAEEERSLLRARTVRFVHVYGARTDDLVAAQPDDARPIARATLTSPGGHLFALERNASRIELPADHFNRYLGEEGLAGPLAERTRTGHLGTPGREQYTRYLKAFVQVGARHDEGYGRVVGQALEIVPGRDPSRLRPGDTLPVTVRFRGRPLTDVRIEALGRADARAVTTVASRTDAHGVAHLVIAHDGVWIVRLVHMIACEHCTDTDWQSFWASYVFGVCTTPAASCAGITVLVPPTPAGEPDR